MSNPEKSRKPLIVGIVAAVVLLGVLLALVLTNCVAGQGTQNTDPVQSTGGEDEIPTYDLYWNVDRDLYNGKSEAGMSSRKPEADGYFHVRFFKDGEILELKIADRKTVNAMEINHLMGLEFDQDGIVVGVIPLKELPVDTKGMDFYVQSYGTGALKINSAKTFNGMEIMLDTSKALGIWDMTGMEGDVGTEIRPIQGDRVKVISNEAGEVTHVFVYDRPEFMKTFEGECEHCDKKVVWKMYTKTDTLPFTMDGHYQLQNDIQLKAMQSLKAEAKICLDLNGYTVNGAENKGVVCIYSVGAELAIMDTSEAQTGKLRGHGEYAGGGGVILVRQGVGYLYSGTLDAKNLTATDGAAISVAKGQYFYMHGGTILGGTAKAKYNDANKVVYGRGGSVAVQGKFVMYDGIIQGGRAVGIVTKWKADGTPSSYGRGMGGNVNVNNTGEFIMEGGTIKNGISLNNGGNIYADGTAVITINGGTITGGKCTGYHRNGGNICVGSAKAVLTINGGYITDGTSFYTAGNLYNAGTVHMNGGYISGGKCRDLDTGKVVADAMYSNVYNVNGRFAMSGGIVTGGFACADTKADDGKQAIMGVGGMAQITSNGSEKYPDLTLQVAGDNVLFVVANRMHDSAKIGVNTNMGIFSNETFADNLDNFYSNVEGAEICLVDGCLGLGRFSCICGKNEDGKHFGACDGTQLFWGPAGSTLTATNGNFYLTQDLVDKYQITARDGVNMAIDLNGYTIHAREGARALSVQSADASITLTDSSAAQTGKVRTFGTGEACRGNTVLLLNGGTFNLYAGVLDGSELTATGGWSAGDDKIFGTEDDRDNAYADGGAVAIDKQSTFNMYGGTIIGSNMVSSVLTKTVTEGEGEAAVTKEITRAVACPNGGAVAVGLNSKFNMYGGTVTGGQLEAAYDSKTKVYSGGLGGAFYSNSWGAQLNLVGGTVIGGSALDGGSIYMDNAAATINMGDGVTITGGQCLRSGGSIRLNAGTFNMTGGLLTGGNSPRYGGNIFAAGNLNITGGQILNGTAPLGGGNITINGKDAVVLLQGVEIAGGGAAKLSNSGGNILVFTFGVRELTIGEGTSITGGQAKNGGNLYITSTSLSTAINITGGTISGGVATESGGNIYLSGSPVALTMSGGTVSGGEATTSYGGNIYVEKGSVAEIRGGKVTNGRAPSGGNVFTNSQLVISGGEISGGKDLSNKDTGNSNCYINDGTLELRGGYVDGCLFVRNGTAKNKSTVKISGQPVVTNKHSGLYLFKASKATALPTVQLDGALSENASVYVTGNVNGVFTTEFAEANLATMQQVFKPDSNDKSIKAVAGATAGTYQLAIEDKVPGDCLCGEIHDNTLAYDDNGTLIGCDAQVVTWQPWDSETSLPNTTGNWMLTKPVTVSETAEIAADQVVVLNLNGQTVTNTTNKRTYTVNGSLTITDTVGGGVLQGGKEVGPLADETYIGAAAYVAEGAKLVLLKGEITGGTTADTGKYLGGNIYADGAVYILGGTVSNGAASSAGGNVYVIQGGKFIMTNGTVTSGHSDSSGGNLFLLCNATILGGTIENGTAKYGSNIFYNGNKKVLTLTNVNITNGSSININFAAGTLNINAGTVITASATSTNASRNIAMSNRNPSTLNLNGGSIDGYVVINDGVKVNVNGAVTVPAGGITVNHPEDTVFGTVSAELPETVKDMFASSIEGMTVALTEGTLTVVKAEAAAE